jgi:hypothetical protein
MEACNDTKRILNYCKETLSEIRSETPTGPLWERRWAAVITLLRTACEVLKREAPDYWKIHMKIPNASVKGRDPEKGWSPQIYGEFICMDANLFLHQGQSRTGQSAIVPLPGAGMQALAAGEVPKPIAPPPPPHAPIISYHMNSGPYSGRHPLDVAEEAIAWLEEQIGIAET